MKQVDSHAVLAEHAGVRSEIEQLNGQIFAAFSSSLALNLGVLGWLFVKDNPSDFYALPTLGVFLLLAGSLIILNRNRVAHRLALFQRFFIEPRIPDICWGRVYFAYRELYKKNRNGFIINLAERLGDSATLVLFIASVLNLLILLVFGLSPYFTLGSTAIDWLQLFNFGLATLIIVIQEWLRRVLTDYTTVEATMGDLARLSGINEASK